MNDVCKIKFSCRLCLTHTVPIWNKLPILWGNGAWGMGDGAMRMGLWGITRVMDLMRQCGMGDGASGKFTPYRDCITRVMDLFIDPKL